MKALSTLEIDRILKNNPVTKKEFIGTFPACIVPTPRDRYAFITNTHSHEKPGEHWNSWVVDKDSVLFFDSFGRDINDPTLPDYYRDFIGSFRNVRFTSVQIQDFKSIACGYFCIHFIYVMSLDLSYEHFVNDYSSDLKLNDVIVNNFINSIK